jgi:5-(carboxyamino)imidazole ribonucleotide synthase
MKLRVGVIGGGQLARMMIAPAQSLGIELKVLAEAQGSSAAQAATMVGDYTNYETLAEFAKTVDVITFDHEHVPLEVLRRLEASGVSVQPSSHALECAQNKLSMRRRLQELGLPMPVWAEVRNAEDLQEFLNSNGGQCILKTPIGGYDGKGVRVIRSVDEAHDWLDSDFLASLGGALLAEEKVDFVRELAQLSARNSSGAWQSWPLVQTIQEQGVCSQVISPAPGANQQTLTEAADIAKRVAEGIGVTGVLAVEMFEAGDGGLLINELAMRPHNSGHFSIEGSVTSQFEQHLRAVLDLPLGATDARAAWAVMVNLLGVDDKKDFVSGAATALAVGPQAKVHTYGKSARKGRKMGHVTVLGLTLPEVVSQANAAAQALLQG